MNQIKQKTKVKGLFSYLLHSPCLMYICEKNVDIQPNFVMYRFLLALSLWPMGAECSQCGDLRYIPFPQHWRSTGPRPSAVWRLDPVYSIIFS